MASENNRLLYSS